MEDDDDETVNIDVWHSSDRGHSEVAPTQTTVNITDDDDPEVNVSFAAAAYTVAEGGRVTVTVRLSADPERMVDIPLTAAAQSNASDRPGRDRPARLLGAAHQR